MMRSFQDLRLSETGRNASYARLWNGLLQRLDQIRIEASPPLRTEVTMSHTQINIDFVRRNNNGSGGTGGLFPFQIYQFTPPAPPATPAASDWRTFRVHTGNIFLPYQEASLTPDNDDASGSPLNIIVPASTDDYEIYLKITPFSVVTIAAGVSGAITGHGFGSTGNGEVFVNTDGSWNMLIGTVTTSADPTPTGPTPPFPSGTVEIDQELDQDVVWLAAPAFPVNVTQTGGLAGTSSGVCTFTYTAYDLLGNQIGVGMSPVFSPARTVNCTCVKGTQGTAYYDNTGTLQLASVNETQTQTNC